MSSGTRNFFRNALNNMVEARQRQANRQVQGALLMLDDDALKALGHTREELRRNGASGGSFY